MNTDLKLDWNKGEGLIPAVVQDATTQRVLMLGYMNQESFTQTLETGRVTFYNRSRQSIWVKGETSGNTLSVVDLKQDCDQDAILIQAKPEGPTCHRETGSCFDGELDFLNTLENIIETRIKDGGENSYVNRLFASGLDRVAQKVGEEAVETVIAAKNDDLGNFENEAADLLFHLMVLLRKKDTKLSKLVTVLQKRHR